jgi:hypothetical protein
MCRRWLAQFPNCGGHTDLVDVTFCHVKILNRKKDCHNIIEDIFVRHHYCAKHERQWRVSWDVKFSTAEKRVEEAESAVRKFPDNKYAEGYLAYRKRLLDDLGEQNGQEWDRVWGKDGEFVEYLETVDRSKL